MKMLKYLVSLGIAAGAGMAIGILTAPRKGKHTRSKLRNDLDVAREDIETAANKKLSSAKNILNKAVEKQQKNGQVAIDKIKETVHI